MLSYWDYLDYVDIKEMKRRFSKYNGYEILEPAKYQHQKSFNHRAHTYYDEATQTVSLFSYYTCICSLDTKNELITFYGNYYSVTTLKHLNAFLYKYTRVLPFNKKHYLEFCYSICKILKSGWIEKIHET